MSFFHRASSQAEDLIALARLQSLRIADIQRTLTAYDSRETRTGAAQAACRDAGACSQFKQDVWVRDTLERLEIAPLARRRFYVDLAAFHPTTGSNTAFFDALGWDGVCIDGNPKTVRQFQQSSRSCQIVEAAVDSCARIIEWGGVGQTSGIKASEFASDRASDAHSDESPAARRRVKTRLLVDILRNARAPPVIDYMSLDIEGAEYEALRRFPFDEFRFLTMTVERPPPWLNALLRENGMVWMRNSEATVDSFYVHESLLAGEGADKGAGAASLPRPVPAEVEQIEATTRLPGASPCRKERRCPWPPSRPVGACEVAEGEEEE